MVKGIEKIRNIGFVAHIDAGKTTVTERILYYTGKIHRMGEVDEGTATTDWMIQEKERGITITSAATTCIWRNHTINIIDTPGHVDFTAEVERALRILDGLVVIFCGVSGVQPQSETVWREADKYDIPRLAFINKLDRVGADPQRVVKEISQKFNIRPLVLQKPVGIESDFIGVIDIVERKKLLWDVDELGVKYRVLKVEMDEISKEYEGLVEVLSEIDEQVFEEYSQKEVVDPLVLKRAIRKGTIKGLFVPVLMGSALKRKGIQPLIDAIVDYLPSPLDVDVPMGYHPVTGDIIERKPLPEEPFSGVIFKVQWDKHTGRLLYTRIYSGKLRVNQKVLNTINKRVDKVTRIFRMHADKREPLREAKAGDIVALVGLKMAKTGDTICDPNAPIIYEGMEFPKPVMSVAIEPVKSEELERLKKALEDMLYEDPTFDVKEDPETGQIIISGMGMLHLEIIVDRLKREFNTPVRVGKPQVNYRETIKEEAEVEYEFSKEIAGNLERGKVKIRVKPSKRMVNLVKVKVEGLSEEEKRDLTNTAFETLNYSPLFGYQLVGVELEILEVSSERTPLGTKIALKNAIREAILKAKPVLMEPIMLLEIVVPSEYVGNVIGDLGQRGGELIGIENVSDKVQKIKSKAPLKNLFDYATKLRSLTQGRAGLWMKLAGFAPVPEKEIKEMLSFR